MNLQEPSVSNFGRRGWAVLLLAGLVLVSIAATRSIEYDEGYTIFLASGTARPVWPDAPFRAGAAIAATRGNSSLDGIAADLRRGDVHPPLYFWAVAGWRAVLGEGLFVTRLFSVLCALGALALAGGIARACAAPTALAMLLTLGCYGFAYTGAIARGFALALLLALAGVWAALQGEQARRPAWALCAGMFLGAASFTNYLAIFMTCAVLAWLALGLWSRPIRAAWLIGATILGLLPWLAADVSMFLAQRGSRTAQFPPFDLVASLTRLAHYMAAAIFGGLPLYAGAARGLVAAALAGLLLLLLLGLLRRVWKWHPALLFGAVAPPAGLLALGMLFNTTPIELRYLAFATPFVGILLAAVIVDLPRRAGGVVLGLVLAVQATSIIGLITRPETMQPQAAAARGAVQLAGPDGLVLLPRGNDGVGVAGAFLLAAAPGVRVQIVPPNLSSASAFPRLVLVLLGLDQDSRAAVADMTAWFAAEPCWRRAASAPQLQAYDWTCMVE